MCEPTTAILGAGMALSGAGTVASSISGHQQGLAQYAGQKAMTRHRNRVALQQHQYRVDQRNREWQQTLKIYEMKTKQYQQQRQENLETLYQAYEDGQIRLNNQIAATKQTNFDAWRRLVGMQGYAAASGRQGRRAAMVDRMNSMTAGIERQRRLDDLTKYGQEYERIADQMRNKAHNANMNAWYQVSVAPQQTAPIPAPLMEPQTAVRPSSLGMYGGIASGVGSMLQGAAGLMKSPGSLGGGGSPYSTEGVPGMESITGQDWFKNVSYDVPSQFGTSSSLKAPTFGQGGNNLLGGLTNSVFSNLIPGM